MCRWVQHCKGGEIDTKDEYRPCRPITVCNERPLRWVNKVNEGNPYTFISDVCSRFDLSRVTMKRILPNDFHVRNRLVTWLPHLADGESEETEFCARRNCFKCVGLVAQNAHAMLLRNAKRGYPFMESKNKPANQMWMGENDLRLAVLRAGFQGRKCFQSFHCFYFSLNGPVTGDVLQEKSTLAAICHLETALAKVMQSIPL